MVAGGVSPGGITSAHSTSTTAATTNPGLPQRVAADSGRAAAHSQAAHQLATDGGGSSAEDGQLHVEDVPPEERRQGSSAADDGEAASAQALSGGGELPQKERSERAVTFASAESEEVRRAADAPASQPPRAAHARAADEPVAAEAGGDVWQECEHGAVRVRGSHASPRGFVMRDEAEVPRCVRPACDVVTGAVRALQVAVRRKLQEYRVAKHRGRSYGSRRMGDLFCGTGT